MRDLVKLEVLICLYLTPKRFVFVLTDPLMVEKCAKVINDLWPISFLFPTEIVMLVSFHFQFIDQQAFLNNFDC